MPYIYKPITPEVRAAVAADLRTGELKRDEIAARYGVSGGFVSGIKRQLNISTHTPPVEADKKVGSLDWREAIQAARSMQDIKSKMSWSQDFANISLGDGTEPVILLGFGDQHVGAYGCDYEAFESITDEIIKTPNLYVALMGDTGEYAIKFRSVFEITSQVFTPDMQDAFLESWLDDIQSKVAFAVWDNHGIIRQENQAGSSTLKNILNRRVVYHNGIGHSNITVGNQVYKVAASHKFRGGSMFNRMHAQGRYKRQEAADRELVLMADIHTWGYMHTEDGGTEAVYITGGKLHTGSGYDRRFYSLSTAIHYPCCVLMHDRHEMVPFKTVWQARMFIEGWKASK